MAVSVSGPLSRVDDAFGERAVPILRRVSEQLSSTWRTEPAAGAGGPERKGLLGQDQAHAGASQRVIGQPVIFFGRAGA